MSIRARVIILSSATVSIAIVVAVVGSYIAVRSQLLGQVDDALRSQAQFAQRLGANGPIGPNGPKLPDNAQRIAVAPPEGSGFVLQRIKPDGAVNVFGGQLERLPVTARDRMIARTGRGTYAREIDTAGVPHYRAITVGVGSSGAVVVGRSLEAVDGLLRTLRIVLGFMLLIGVAVAGLLGLLVARNITKPVIELSSEADIIGKTNDLSRRIELDRDDEIGRLAVNFNTMLDTIAVSRAALERSVDSQRRLVADASHELRTPVAAVRMNVETALDHSQLSDEARKEILTEAVAGLAELAELINDVIELARGDEPIEDFEAVRVDEVARDCVERFKRLAPGREVNADLQPTVVDGRPDRIGRAINNLLDNANKYSPAGEPIEIVVREGEVVVADHGPGVPADDRAHVFDRFWRGSGAREKPGSGLGLAIVRQVAESHGGTVELVDHEGGGSRFVLRLAPRDSV